MYCYFYGMEKSYDKHNNNLKTLCLHRLTQRCANKSVHGYRSMEKLQDS